MWTWAGRESVNVSNTQPAWRWTKLPRGGEGGDSRFFCVWGKNPTKELEVDACHHDLSWSAQDLEPLWARLFDSDPSHSIDRGGQNNHAGRSLWRTETAFVLNDTLQRFCAVWHAHMGQAAGACWRDALWRCFFERSHRLRSKSVWNSAHHHTDQSIVHNPSPTVLQSEASKRFGCLHRLDGCSGTVGFVSSADVAHALHAGNTRSSGRRAARDGFPLFHRFSSVPIGSERSRSAARYVERRDVSDGSQRGGGGGHCCWQTCGGRRRIM